MKNKYTFKTPSLCKALGITRMTVFNWEQKGIFTAPRNLKGERVFTKRQMKAIISAFSPGGKFKWHFKG